MHTQQSVRYAGLVVRNETQQDIRASRQVVRDVGVLAGRQHPHLDLRTRLCEGRGTLGAGVEEILDVLVLVPGLTGDSSMKSIVSDTLRAVILPAAGRTSGLSKRSSEVSLTVTGVPLTTPASPKMRASWTSSRVLFAAVGVYHDR
ncbi:MAG: hypothetical protein WBL53_01560 [Pseudonocardiaceae bacterium]